MIEENQVYTGQGLICLTEKLVIESINQTIEEGTIYCKCDICLSDIAALALNHLPPRYVTNLLDYAPSLDKLSLDKIKRVVEKAVTTVTQNPHH